MNKKKMAMSITSLALVGAVAIGGTLAYLSDQSNQVTNTFNVGTGYTEDDEGHQGLWLDEKDWDGKDEEGNPTERTETGNTYEDLLPGSVVDKDPTFHLTADSIDSYVFAEITGLDALLDKGFFVSDDELDPTTNPDGNKLNDGWLKVSTGDGFDGLYVYVGEPGTTVDDADVVKGGETLPAMFQHIKMSSTMGNDAFQALDDLVGTINVRGVAVQADNNTPEQAMTAAIDALK